MPVTNEGRGNIEAAVKRFDVSAIRKLYTIDMLPYAGNTIKQQIQYLCIFIFYLKPIFLKAVWRLPLLHF